MIFHADYFGWILDKVVVYNCGIILKVFHNDLTKVILPQAQWGSSELTLKMNISKDEKTFLQLFFTFL